MTRLNIKIYRNLMGANDQWAARTRALLKKHHVIMLNLIGSPGSIRVYKVSLGSITG
jgi:hypothetical protein